MSGTNYTPEQLEEMRAAAPELVEALREALEWNASDLEVIDEITPNAEMLEARAKRLRAALARAAVLV